jgi:hypothetical protein
MREDAQRWPVVPVSAWLDNAEVCQEAIDATGDLPHTGEAEFEVFYNYLLVDEPIIQLMPGYLLPLWAEQKVHSETLRALAVAAKIENARNRWLDEMVDNHDAFVSSASSHELNEAIIGLANSRYAKALPDELAACFFERLAALYARHSLSLVLDGKRQVMFERPLALADYEVHAKARHGPVRAPLDALLTLVRADEDQYATATNSWHAWGLGAQLYDDALDIEEDFRRGTLTWTVGRTIECFGGKLPRDSDEFYEVALKEGIVTETLKRAEYHFTRAAELARRSFPRWEPIQHGCRRQTQKLREDYERLLVLERSDH